ncbi:unnamed protein product [Bemisia tabaci]|uniref:peptide chain release factor N(5)-glutamine methyltransferase n=1 Tax=Bemisia tabaci TaxID=7038 RepID=A0A9P0AJ57_BEMTA|nr:unnamed protein product [Bemisia tabaci]
MISKMLCSQVLRSRFYQSAPILSRFYTVDSVITEWSKKFKEAGIPDPESSVRNIVAHVMNLPKLGDLYLKIDENLKENQYEKLIPLFECRLARMPVQYIIKEWEFRDLRLKMVPPVFIPRPETEMLIDIVMNNSPALNSILEVGCGSGAISIALLRSNSSLQSIAIDQSEKACKLTKENADLNEVSRRLNVLHAKLTVEGGFQPTSSEKFIFDQKFDVIVSNPPYVPSSEVLTVEPEIYLYEDLRALEGGKDGLKIIKPLLTVASKLLTKDGLIFLETHYHHSKLISDWINLNPSLNLEFVQTFKDFCEKDRFVQIRKIS